MSAKVTPDLEERVRSSEDDEVVDVVVELKRDDPNFASSASGGQSRSELIDALKTTFEATSSELEAEIQDAGGNVVDSAWINQTVRARLPAKAIARIAERDDVAVIDVPHKIEPESA